MNPQNPSILPPDTIVGKNYCILLFLSAGGFGNTYLAESVSDGKTVVLKELFNRDYMERSPAESSVFISPDSSAAFAEDVRRFKKEWEALNRFRDYPGAVKGIDLVSDNNTMYIVMEHLSGGSLKQSVQKEGPLKPDDLFRRTKDAMQLLSAMHAAGFIHGDISPDNLVASDDGSFRFIDFGAVAEIGSSCGINEKLRKEGYTPAEIFNAQNKISPQTDIYSLCASFCFALTGQTPEDSLERLLFDDLKKPSELNPEIDGDTDSLIMRGLSMSPQDRWGSIDEMQAVIAEIVKPDLEKEQIAAQKAKAQKKKRILLFSSIAALILAAAALFCLTHREQIRFKGKETEKIVFYYPEESDPEAADKLRSNLIQKVESIAGDSGYLLHESEQYLEFTLPYALLREEDIPLLLNKYFNCSQIILAIYENENFYTGMRLDPEYIKNITQTDDGCAITLIESFSEALSKLPQVPAIQIRLILYTHGSGNHYWDLHNQPLEGEEYKISPVFDADSDSLLISDTELGGELGRKLFIDCLNQEPVPLESFNYERHIVWESRQETTWGEYQVPFSSLQGEVALLNYQNSSLKTGNMLTQKVLEQELEINSPDAVTLKRRLDTLRIPYSCGWEEYDESRLCIALEADSIWEAEASLLLNNSEYDSCIKTDSGISVCQLAPDTQIYSEDGGVCVTLPSDGSAEETIDRLIPDGTITLNLCICDIPLLEAHVSDTPEDGRIIFTDFILQNTENSSRSSERFAAFLNQLMSESIDSTHTLTGVSFLKRSGEPDWSRDIWTLSGCEQHTLRDLICRTVTEDSGEVRYTPSSPSRLSVYYYLNDEQEKTKYSHPFGRLINLLETVELTNEVSDIDIMVKDYTSSPTFVYWIDLYANKLTGVPELCWHVDYIADTDSDEAECSKLRLEKAKETCSYLASEKTFDSYCKIPAVSDKYEKIIADNDLLFLKISVGDKAPGENFGLRIEAVNKTAETMTVSFSQMAVNSIMTDVSNRTYTIEPGTSALYDASFQQDRLNFSLFAPIDTVSLLLDVDAGADSFRTAVNFPDTDSYPELPDQLPVSSDAKLLFDTDDFSIYALGFKPNTLISASYEAKYLLINKTDHFLNCTFEGLALNQIQNDPFDMQTVAMMPFTLAYTGLDIFLMYPFPSDYNEVESISTKIKVSYVQEDGNTEPLFEKDCSFKP